MSTFVGLSGMIVPPIKLAVSINSVSTNAEVKLSGVTNHEQYTFTAGYNSAEKLGFHFASDETVSITSPNSSGLVIINYDLIGDQTSYMYTRNSNQAAKPSWTKM
jgi:hypothetical protein